MVTLGEIAEIRAGHAFRGAVTSEPEGQARVIQIRDADLSWGVNWNELQFCNPPGRKQPEWLRGGDIIFQARGRKNFAIHLAELPFDHVVCTQHFFVIRVHDERFSPAFVEWQLNQSIAQEHLDACTPDTNSRSITTATISTTPIAIACAEAQGKLEQLSVLSRREQQLFEELVKNRQQQIAALADQILRGGRGA